MKKKIYLIIAIIIVLLILGVGGYCYYIYNRNLNIELINNEKTIEYGETYNPNLEELIDFDKYNFINKDDVGVQSNIINEEDKDYPAVGEYEITVCYKNKELTQNVTIKDTTSPTIEKIEKLELPYGTNIDEYDFSSYIKINDLSELEDYSIDFSSVDSSKSGEYIAKLSVKDIYENIAEMDFSIVILEEEKQENAENLTTSSTSENQTSNNKKSSSKNTSSSKTSTTNDSSSTSSTSNQSSTTQKDKKTQSSSTQSDTKYWCVDGGSHHIDGDGDNEHGYYKTWDEAFKAFEQYTQGWESAQYRVDQCPCGLYYFWAIK